MNEYVCAVVHYAATTSLLSQCDFVCISDYYLFISDYVCVCVCVCVCVSSEEKKHPALVKATLNAQLPLGTCSAITSAVCPWLYVCMYMYIYSCDTHHTRQ